MEESGCPSIINHIVNVDNIDANIKDTSVCLGNKATLKIITKEKYNYTWYYDYDHNKIVGREQTHSLMPEKSSTYDIVITNGKCTKTLTASVEVNSNPYLEEVSIVDDKNIEIIANGGFSPYEFKIGKDWSSNNIIYNYIEGQFYNIKIRDDKGCVVDTTIKAPTHGLDIPILVSPNGDGVNDVFEIKNIDKYPQSTITIYNGLGKKLIEYKANESRGWDGNYNGIRMPSDDYWYEINIKETDETIVGHFTLIRD